MKDPYAVLGIPSGATDEEVTKAYRALARKYHPDLHPGDKVAEAKMKEVNAAYNQIQDIRSGKASYQPGGSAGAYRNPYGNPYANPYGNPYGGANRGYHSNESYYGRREYRANQTNAEDDQGYTPYQQPIHIFRVPIFRIILMILVLRLLFSLLFGGWIGYSGYSGDYGGYGYYNENGTSAPYTEGAGVTQRTPAAEDWT